MTANTVMSPPDWMWQHGASLPSSSKQPLKDWRSEYRLAQTSLDLNPNLNALKMSDGLGWTGMHASIIEESPHEAVHRAIPDIWLSMALKVRNLRRTYGTVRQQGIIPAGRTVITAPDEAVHDIIDNDSIVLHIFLRQAIIEEVSGELALGSLNNPEIPCAFAVHDPGLNQILSAIREALYEPVHGAALKIDYLARALAAHLLCHHSVHDSTAPILKPSQQLSVRQLRRVLDYIEENLASNIAIADLAKVTGLSKVHFIRKFKASTQQTPYQYVVDTRVQRAKQLLAAPDAEFANIAVTCGFADQAHFSNCFKRVVGTSPSNYRRSSL